MQTERLVLLEKPKTWSQETVVVCVWTRQLIRGEHALIMTFSETLEDCVVWLEHICVIHHKDSNLLILFNKQIRTLTSSVDYIITPVGGE